MSVCKILSSIFSDFYQIFSLRRIHWFLFPLRWALPPGVVDGIFPVQDDLRNRYKGVAFLEQILDDPRKSLGSVQRRVVEQDDGPRLYFGGHTLGDLRGG